MESWDSERCVCYHLETEAYCYMREERRNGIEPRFFNCSMDKGKFARSRQHKRTSSYGANVLVILVNFSGCV